MSDERDDRAFKVEDRRRFTPEGRAREDEAAAATAQAGEAAFEQAAFEQASRGTGGKPSEITFSSFVVGLATQALMFMGAVPDPSGAPIRRNTAEAAALIDILGMLERKTAGNLAEDEARLLEDVLYDLRMRYVRETRRGAGEGSEG